MLDSHVPHFLLFDIAIKFADSRKVIHWTRYEHAVGGYISLIVKENKNVAQTKPHFETCQEHLRNFLEKQPLLRRYV